MKCFFLLHFGSELQSLFHSYHQSEVMGVIALFVFTYKFNLGSCKHLKTLCFFTFVMKLSAAFILNHLIPRHKLKDKLVVFS